MVPTEEVSERGYSEDGVDVTLVRWMLSLTPAERLEALQQFADFVLSIRATSISQPPADPKRSLD